MWNVTTLNKKLHKTILVKIKLFLFFEILAWLRPKLITSFCFDSHDSLNFKPKRPMISEFSRVQAFQTDEVSMPATPNTNIQPLLANKVANTSSVDHMGQMVHASIGGIVIVLFPSYRALCCRESIWRKTAKRRIVPNQHQIELQTSQGENQSKANGFRGPKLFLGAEGCCAPTTSIRTDLYSFLFNSVF